MKITFLGTGTSQGVPVIACECIVCSSNNEKDKRLRSSILIETGDLNIVVDSGPDFRQQMLREDVKRVDAILFTHEHRDHIAGLDDVRSFNYLFKKPMEVYAEPRVQKALKHEFSYVFAEKKYPGIPELVLNTVTEEPFAINKTKIIPIRGFHHLLPVLGFRIGDFAYLTDINRIEDIEKEKLKNLKYFVVTALRKEKHLSHFCLNDALGLIEELKPEKTYLTHISHLMGLHEEVSEELPSHVELAYDQLKINM